MIYELTNEDKIYNESSLRKDDILFNVLFGGILPNEHEIALTNGRSVILGQTNKTLDMWIWTSDDITTVEYNELMTYIPTIYEDNETIAITAKYSVADDIIALLNGKIISTEGLVSYRCDNVISPPPRGIVRHPRPDEVNIIAEFMCGFQRDSFSKTSNVDEYLERANNLITYEHFYILEVNGITVAMTNMGLRGENYMRLASVYTTPEHRNQGHAAYLVSELCKKSHELGKLPILYADEFYPASNKAYRNIGFTECGRLKQIKMVI